MPNRMIDLLRFGVMRVWDDAVANCDDQETVRKNIEDVFKKMESVNMTISGGSDLLDQGRSKVFLSGLKTAIKYGLEYEYTEFFLADFASSCFVSIDVGEDEVRKSTMYALAEWDMLELGEEPGTLVHKLQEFKPDPKPKEGDESGEEDDEIPF